MGTNYYVKTETCDHCGHKPEGLHIGKSSAGWQFLFQRIEEPLLHTMQAWKTFLEGKEIVDEYGRTILPDNFWSLVESKQDGLNAKTATLEQYGAPLAERHRYEYSDPDGYRFMRTEFS